MNHIIREYGKEYKWRHGNPEKNVPRETKKKEKKTGNQEGINIGNMKS